MQPGSGREIYTDILIALSLVWSNLCSSSQHKLPLVLYPLVLYRTVSIETLIKPQVFCLKHFSRPSSQKAKLLERPSLTCAVGMMIHCNSSHVAMALRPFTCTHMLHSWICRYSRAIWCQVALSCVMKDHLKELALALFRVSFASPWPRLLFTIFWTTSSASSWRQGCHLSLLATSQLYRICVILVECTILHIAGMSNRNFGFASTDWAKAVFVRWEASHVYRHDSEKRSLP